MEVICDKATFAWLSAAAAAATDAAGSDWREALALASFAVAFDRAVLTCRLSLPPAALAWTCACPTRASAAAIRSAA